MQGFSGVGFGSARLIGGRGHIDVAYHAGGTITLTEDLYCNSLSLAAAVTMNTGGYRIYARNFIHLQGGSIIRHNGAVGAVGTGSALGGAGAAIGTTGGGGSGGDGGSGAGSTAPAFSNGQSLGGSGGAGAGGSGPGATAGFGRAGGFSPGLWGAILQPSLADLCGVFGTGGGITDPTVFRFVVGGGGGGGGGGTGNGSGLGRGGAGGGGGGIVYLTADEIMIDDTSQIQAKGGNGGNGDSTGGDSGGGGGGGGGGIIVKANFVRIANGAGFNIGGGTGGNGGGAGAAGVNGDAGGSVLVFSPHGSERLTGAATFLGATYPLLPRR